MMRKLVVCLTIGLLAAVLPAGAAELGLGLRVGTYGLGAELGVGISERIGIRAGYYALDVSDTYEETGIVYDGDFRLGGFGALVDFYPFKGGLHFSAGVFANDNEIRLDAAPTSPQQIGDTIYTPAQIGTLTGVVAFDDTAPYFGIGWGRLTGKRRAAFLFDVGLIRQGGAEIGLRSSTGLIDPADLQAEIDQIERDIEDYDLWPVLALGVAIRF